MLRTATACILFLANLVSMGCSRYDYDGRAEGSSLKRDPDAAQRKDDNPVVDIDQILRRGMNMQQAFVALEVSHRHASSFGSVRRSHFLVQCHRCPGRVVQLEFRLTRDGFQLWHWSLLGDPDSRMPSSWVEVDGDWAREQDREMKKTFDGLQQFEQAK